jgi:hypothetical protein
MIHWDFLMIVFELFTFGLFSHAIGITTVHGSRVRVHHSSRFTGGRVR